MDVEVTVPENFMGDIMGDLNIEGPHSGDDPLSEQTVRRRLPWLKCMIMR